MNCCFSAVFAELLQLFFDLIVAFLIVSADIIARLADTA
jgi:hypothetical protein